MNTTPARFALILLLWAVIGWRAHAGDLDFGLAPPAVPVTLTNSAQLAESLVEYEWHYPHGIYPWQPGGFEAAAVWWTDFESLDKELAVVRDLPSAEQFGVAMWPVWLFLHRDSGRVVARYPWSETRLAELAALDRKAARAVHDGLIADFAALHGMPRSQAAQVVEGANAVMGDPVVVLNVWLADVGDRPTFEKNRAEQEAVADERLANSVAEPQLFAREDDGEGSGGMALMMMGGGENCGLTNDVAVLDAAFSLYFNAESNLTARVEYWSCTNRLYRVRTSTNMVDWATELTHVGVDGVSVWEDSEVTTRERRFYRATQYTFTGDTDGDGLTNWEEFDEHGTDLSNPDSDGDWLPDGWEVEHSYDPLAANWDSDFDEDNMPDWWELFFGLDPDDSDDANDDPDSDTRTNLQEYYDGTDPNVAQPGGTALDIIVNGGNAWATSTNITLQSLAVPYPKLKVSHAPNMTNATTFINTLEPVSYTLPANGDVNYYLYVQYASYNGTAIGPVLFKTLTLDTRPPFVEITGPTTSTNGSGNQAFIHVQATVYDPAPTGGVDVTRPLTTYMDGGLIGRQGTQVEEPRWPVVIGTNEIHVVVIDQAGQSSSDTLTWIVTTAGDTNAPAVTNLNLVADTGPGATGAVTVPDWPDLWVQGDLADSNAIVTAAVNERAPIMLNVMGNQFGQFVPLEFGTNALVIIAADAAGNATSNTYNVVRSDRFHVAITNLVFGVFANGQSNIVSGYVSAKIDEGAAGETNLVSLTINGVGTTLHWGQMDEDGHVPFETNDPLPPPANGRFEPLNAETEWANGDHHTSPAGLRASYEVLRKEMRHDTVWLQPDGGGVVRAPWTGCGANWRILLVENGSFTNAYQLAGGTDLVSVNRYFRDREATGVCSADPENDPAIWGAWSAWELVASTNEPARSLAFGTRRWYWREMFDDGDEALFPWVNDQTTAWLRFRAPVVYPPNTTVVLTFEGMDYARPAGVALDLSQVKYRGLGPVAWSNEVGTVSYRVVVDGGKEYTLAEEHFHWPTLTTNYVEDVGDRLSANAITYHSLSWTNFHNCALDIWGRSFVCPATQQNPHRFKLNVSPAGTQASWSIVPGSDTSGGATVNQQTGEITPGPNPGTFILQASSVDDPSCMDTQLVTVLETTQTSPPPANPEQGLLEAERDVLDESDKAMADKIFKSAMLDAATEARQRFPINNEDGSKGNAFQHAYWNWLLAARFDSEFAKRLTDAHENYVGNGCDNKSMDLSNNKIGLDLYQHYFDPATGKPKISDERAADILEELADKGKMPTAIGGGGSL